MEANCVMIWRGRPVLQYLQSHPQTFLMSFADLARYVLDQLDSQSPTPGPPHPSPLTLNARTTFLAISFSAAVRRTGYLFSLPESSLSTCPSRAWSEGGNKRKVYKVTPISASLCSPHVQQTSWLRRGRSPHPQHTPSRLCHRWAWTLRRCRTLYSSRCSPCNTHCSCL